MLQMLISIYSISVFFRTDRSAAASDTAYATLDAWNEGQKQNEAETFYVT